MALTLDDWLKIATFAMPFLEKFVEILEAVLIGAKRGPEKKAKAMKMASGLLEGSFTPEVAGSVSQTIDEIVKKRNEKGWSVT